MSTRNYIEELEYGDAKGLDTTSPLNLMAPGYIRLGVNVNLGITGGYTKRSGYLNQFTYDNQLNGFSIRQGIEYRKKEQANTDPTVEIILYATNNNITTPVAKLGKILSGVFNEFVDEDGVALSISNNSLLPARVPLSISQRPAFAQINNSLYFINGATQPRVYEENSVYTRRTGIQSPEDMHSPNPALTDIQGSAGAGNLIEESDYIYAFTYAFYLNGQLVAESSPSLLASITLQTGENTVTLKIREFKNYATLIAAGLSHLDIRIRIFRTVAGGSILFLEDEITAGPGVGINNEVTHVSVISDDGLQPEQISFDNTVLNYYEDYEYARFPVIARNRVFVFHPTRNSGRFSKIGFKGPLPESFPVLNEFSVEGKYGAADNLIGAGQIKGIPIILKERSIGRLEEVGISDLSSAEETVAFVYREISEAAGGVSHFAQTQVFDELVFLGRDNVYATDGQTVRPIATPIQSVIKASDFTADHASKLSAINDTKNKRIYISIYSDNNQNEPNVLLVGDYQQYPNFRWTTYEAGPENNMPGIKAGCFFQTEATANGGLEIYFGSATKEGQYYRMNVGNDDYKVEENATQEPDPQIIYMRLISRPYMLNQPLNKKLYKVVKIYAEGQPQQYDFEFGAIFDVSGVESGIQALTVPGTGTSWNNYNWAPSLPTNTQLVWSGPAFNEFQYRPHRKAQLMQLVFTQDDQTAPVTLLGWGVSGSSFGPI